MGFRQVTAKHPGAYPLLERSLREEKPAMHQKVEWLVDDGSEEGKIALRTIYNYTEMFRGPSAENVAAQIESALFSGQRTIASGSRKTMGGALFFLDRPPTSEDQFGLRILHDLHRRMIGGEVSDVWLAEVSVMACAPSLATV